MASRGWRPAWRTALARPEPAHHSVAVGAGRECPRWTLPCQGKPVSIGRIQTQRALFPPRRLASCPRNRHLRPGPEHRLFLQSSARLLPGASRRPETTRHVWQDLRSSADGIQAICRLGLRYGAPTGETCPHIPYGRQTSGQTVHPLLGLKHLFPSPPRVFCLPSLLSAPQGGSTAHRLLHPLSPASVAGPG